MTNQPKPRTRGPHAGYVALSTLAVTVVGVVVARLVSSGSVGGTPFTDPTTYAAGLETHPGATRLLALCQLGAAVPLAVYAATVRVQLERLGARVPGPVIALSGGMLAGAALVASGCATFAQSSAAVAHDPAVTLALGWFAFASGGVGYAMGVGLLLAGVAVPSLVLGLLPRWLAAAGLVLAVVAEVSWLGLALDPLQYLVPVARFAGGVWLVVAGFALPRSRRARKGQPS